MQFQADVLGVPVSVPEISETTALGAAYLAGIAAGVWERAEVVRALARGRPLRAAMSADERELLIAGWAARSSAARDWARPE